MRPLVPCFGLRLNQPMGFKARMDAQSSAFSLAHNDPQSTLA